MHNRNIVNVIFMWKNQILIPSRWYSYIFNGKPWGISSDILLKSPHLLLTSKNIVCDEEGFKSDKRAADKLGWTTGEIFVLLKKRGILKTESFKRPIDNALFYDPTIKTNIQNELMKLNYDTFFQKINYVDNILTGALSSTLDSTNAYIYQNDTDNCQYFEKSKILFDIYLDENFYLIPPLPAKLIRIQNEISKIQAPYLDSLAKFEINYEEYQDTVYDLHHNLDVQIDDYYKNYRDDKGVTKGLNYLEKLDLIIEFRKKFQTISLDIIEDYTEGVDNTCKIERMKKDFSEQIKRERLDFIKMEKTAKCHLKVSFGLSAVLGCGSILLKQPSLFFACIIPLANNIIENYNVKNRYPFGYVKVSLEKIQKKRR